MAILVSRETRVPVSTIVASIADGDRTEKVLNAYPQLTAEDVEAALKFASEILYVYRGVVRKYRPDFLIRLASGENVILEVKGQDLEQDQVKRRFLDEWVKAVNEHGGFGAWAWEVSKNPGDIKDLLAKHVQPAKL